MSLEQQHEDYCPLSDRNNFWVEGVGVRLTPEKTTDIYQSKNYPGDLEIARTVGTGLGQLLDSFFKKLRYTSKEIKDFVFEPAQGAHGCTEVLWD